MRSCTILKVQMREGTILLPFAGVLPRELNENSFFQIKNIGIKKTFIDPDKKGLSP